MVSACEGELICDFAETYHIYDHRALPLSTVAALAGGLRSNSRARMALAGEKHTLSEMLGVLIFDKLSLLVWLNSKDGARGKNRPESLAAKLFGTPNEPQTEGFDDPMTYEKARQKILDGGD